MAVNQKIKEIKQSLKELIREEPDAFKEMMNEILLELESPRSEEIANLIRNNFDRFGPTFQALA